MSEAALRMPAFKSLHHTGADVINNNDPRILWAGGVPWDLRASTDRPVPAWIPRGTSHMHSAAVRPAEAPTPLWDSFLAAVWPDPGVRAWALRVLSVPFAGVSGAALPILYGAQRRGKTQVMHLLSSVLGSYAVDAGSKLLSGTGRHDLTGRRLAIIDGPRAGWYSQEHLSQLTGAGVLTARRRDERITFRPTHTLVIVTSEAPPLTDPEVRVRVRAILCDGDEAAVRAARQAIGVTHGRVWRAEAPGVLWKMIVEAGRWLDAPGSALTGPESTSRIPSR